MARVVEFLLKQAVPIFFLVALILVGVFASAFRMLPPLQHREDLIQDQAIGSKDADPCILKDLRSVPSHKGYVAILRDVNCPGILAQGSGYLAIFVHKAGEANTKSNLAFQYAPDDEDRPEQLPTIRWVGETLLKITQSGRIDELVKQRNRIGAIDIEYSLRRVLWNDVSSGSFH